jgi:hypothetical protein
MGELEKKVSNLTWMWEIFVQGSHTEHCWRCFNECGSFAYYPNISSWPHPVGGETASLVRVLVPTSVVQYLSFDRDLGFWQNSEPLVCITLRTWPKTCSWYPKPANTGTSSQPGGNPGRNWDSSVAYTYTITSSLYCACVRLCLCVCVFFGCQFTYVAKVAMVCKSQIWLQVKYERKISQTSFYVIDYLLEPYIKVWWFFLNFDHILTIDNLEKHLILELSFLAIYIYIASQEKAVTTNE